MELGFLVTAFAELVTLEDNSFVLVGGSFPLEVLTIGVVFFLNST
jgi:hypothetical protein